MATNIIDTVQKNLGYPELKKIDPNTQDVKEKGTVSEANQLAQAAIPAVLTGLYKLSRNDAGSNEILNLDSSMDSLPVLFDGKDSEIVEKVAQYAGVSEGDAAQHMEKIADESIREIKASGNNDAQKLKQYMNDQRHNILVYLPASLNIGDILKDESLDDKTNKMEGPISNFMHKIENKLSQGGE